MWAVVGRGCFDGSDCSTSGKKIGVFCVIVLD